MLSKTSLLILVLFLVVDATEPMMIETATEVVVIETIKTLTTQTTDLVIVDNNVEMHEETTLAETTLAEITQEILETKNSLSENL